MKRQYLITPFLAFAGGALVAILLHQFQSGPAGETIDVVKPTRLDRRPDIKITDGKLVAAKRTSINLFTRGTLDFVAEDGMVVHRGEKLASLERKDAEEDLQKTQIDLSNQEANLRQALITRDDEMPRLITNEKTEVAKVELAQLRLQRLLALPDPLDWNSQREVARLSLVRFKNAAQDRDNTASLFADGYASKADLRQRENGFSKALLSLAGVGLDTRNLLAGATRSQLAQADLAYRRALLSLETLRLSQANRREQLLAAIEQEEAAIRYHKERIAKVTDTLAKHEVIAPHDGLVELVSRHGQTTKIQVGDRVWSGMSVMMLTDLQSMRVRAVMHENYVRMVTPGKTRATVVIPSNPGRKYKGVVSWIDRWAKDKGDVEDQAERKEIGMSGVQVFNIYVDIEEVDSDNLKPGRVAEIFIEPDPQPVVLALPRGAIIEQDGRTFVNVVQGDRRVLTQISVLELDLERVQVIDGIDEQTAVEVRQ